MRWLLNSLEAQTAPPGSFELVVVHDPLQPEIPEIIAEHPLRERSTIRTVVVSPVASASQRRNHGWRAASGEIMAFAAPDLRLSRTWVAGLISRAPFEGILEGCVVPDPVEGNLLRSPLSCTWNSTPPAPIMPAANIACARELLERCDGFDEALPASAFDGAVLAVRAERAGAARHPAPALVAYSGIEALAPRDLFRRLTSASRLAAVISRYPELGDLAPRPPRPDDGARDKLLGAARWASWMVGAMTAPHR